MKAHHLIFAAVLTMAVICGGCADKQERSDGPHRMLYEKAGRFSYDPPDQWKISSMDGLDYRVASAPRRGRFASNINVVEESFGGSLEAYADGNIKSMKQGFKNLKILSRGEFRTKDNQPAVKLVTENSQRGMRLRQTFYFLGTGRTKFVVTCTTTARGGASLDPVFERSVATFRFHK
ncbi:MAG: hypothetical protein QGH60_02835 [Phycisphaerae bacterium]|jgi:hypothetical protein|nr:hypothetical protein [Phycisphaerae bacterium]